MWTLPYSWLAREAKVLSYPQQPPAAVVEKFAGSRAAMIARGIFPQGGRSAATNNITLTER
jgi:hypothetical protein